MDLLKNIVLGIDRLNEWVGRSISWVAVLMVAVVTGDVIMRYLFGKSFVFMQELEWHLFGVLFLIGAGYTLLHDSHVRVDIFYQRLTERQQAWINLLGVLIFLLPGCFLVLDTSIPYTAASWSVGEGSPDPGGLPARYLLKAVIPLGFTLLTLQGLAMGLRSILLLSGHSVGPERSKGLQS